MNYAIILAGGTGTRAGSTLPKQFQMVGGLRMFWWSVIAFQKFDPSCKIILVVHPDFLKNWETLFGEEERRLNINIEKVAGGKSRIESVRHGLEFVAESLKIESEHMDDGSAAIVYIHDSARPYITPQLIERGCDLVMPGRGAIPVVPIADSLRRLTENGSVAADRSEYVAVQTPQIFILEDILSAYRNLTDESGLTDDASIAEKSGMKISTFEGDPANIKVTTAFDLKNAIQ